MITREINHARVAVVIEGKAQRGLRRHADCWGARGARCATWEELAESKHFGGKVAKQQGRLRDEEKVSRQSDGGCFPPLEFRTGIENTSERERQGKEEKKVER